jgi:hypothetical protein
MKKIAVFRPLELHGNKIAHDTASWANELHPTNPSFEKIAKRFYQAIVS